MKIEEKDGEDFLINCHEDSNEIATYWYELNRRGEDIKGVSSTVCRLCFVLLYYDMFTIKEIEDMFNK